MSLEECAKMCVECASTCSKTETYCIMKGGAHTDPNHLTLMVDCKEICIVAGDFMIRGSENHSLTCGICAEICEKCANDCQRVDPNDKVMKECAEKCTECAEMCRKLSKDTNGKMAKEFKEKLVQCCQ
mmetsp:Transcript_23632/g.33072  ORF Transcript_23632/g.33072 Transcript_23632/m.33072 type:complete len:128 (+) Transcript_23632:323-706(+)